MNNIPCSLAAILAALTIASSIAGCSGDDNRTVTKEEVEAADAKRLEYIDTLKVSDAQKAQMKAHMGGPAVPNPATQAIPAHPESQTGRRN